MPDWIYIIPILGIIALIFAFIKARWVNKQDPGTEKMIEISGYVREGAMAFLKMIPLSAILSILGKGPMLPDL